MRMDGGISSVEEARDPISVMLEIRRERAMDVLHVVQTYGGVLRDALRAGEQVHALVQEVAWRHGRIDRLAITDVASEKAGGEVPGDGPLSPRPILSLGPGVIEPVAIATAVVQGANVVNSPLPEGRGFRLSA